MKDRTLPRVLVASFLSSHVEACYCHDLLHRSAHITLHCSHSDLSSYLSNKCVPRLLSIARNDARDMKMSCFKVKPRSQVTKSTVKQFGTKNIHIWQPYVLVGHLAWHPLPKTCSNNRMEFFLMCLFFFFFFCDYAENIWAKGAMLWLREAYSPKFNFEQFPGISNIPN